MELRCTASTAPKCSASRLGATVPARRRWLQLSCATLGLSVLLSFACYGRLWLPKLPPETMASPIAVAVTVNPAPGRGHPYSIAFYERIEGNAGLAKLEEAAGSLRGKLSGRRGLVVVDSPASADVIVELRGLYDPGSIVQPHHVWGAVYATRNPRLLLGSPYAVESNPRPSGPLTVGGAVKHFATDVETIVADNFEMIVSLRSRPIDDTGPIEPTATAPLQGEYSLAVTPSPSCPAPSVGAMRSDYDVSIYQHGNTLLLLVRGLCPDSFRCRDKMRGQVVGDEMTLRSTHNPAFLLFPTGATADGWVWEGKGTGRVREDRIDVTVVGKISLYRKGEHTDERIYSCEAADHRWTLTRHR